MYVIASDEVSNTAAIAASGTGQIPTDTSILKDIGLRPNQQFYNYCFLTNGHTSAIRVKIGKDTQRIGAGDAFEWGSDKRIIFDTIIIEELGTAVQIDIGDIKANIARLR